MRVIATADVVSQFAIEQRIKYPIASRVNVGQRADQQSCKRQPIAQYIVRVDVGEYARLNDDWEQQRQPERRPAYEMKYDDAKN